MHHATKTENDRHLLARIQNKDKEDEEENQTNEFVIDREPNERARGRVEMIFFLRFFIELPHGIVAILMIMQRNVISM